MNRSRHPSGTVSPHHLSREHSVAFSGTGTGTGAGGASGGAERGRGKTWLLDSKYVLGEELGRGSSGKVYRALNQGGGSQFVAIKEIPLVGMSAAAARAVESEVELLRNLSHPQIIRFHETIRTEHHLYLVLEYVENGSLASILKTFGRLPEHMLIVYMRQVLRDTSETQTRPHASDTSDTPLAAASNNAAFLSSLASIERAHRAPTPAFLVSCPFFRCWRGLSGFTHRASATETSRAPTS